MKFIVIREVFIDVFEESVNEMLKLGYILHGSPFISKGGLFCQAFIKED